jgi:hypothetical protein
MNLKDSNKAITRLNLVLRTLKKVNQLLVRESDRQKLLQGICNILIENRGYFNAWIALLGEANELITIAEAGLGDEFLPMADRLKQGELVQCARKAISQTEVVLTKDPVSTCTDCPV